LGKAGVGAERVEVKFLQVECWIFNANQASYSNYH
jgi:hypothetical protein